MFTKLFLPLSMLSWLLFDGTGGDAGAGDGGTGAAGGAAGGNAGAGAGSGTPPADAGGAGAGNGGGTPAGGDAGGEQTVPYARFKEVNDELARRRAADQAKADEEAAKAGDFEKVKQRIETENGSLKETLSEVARRNAFYDAGNGKTANLRLAYIAAGEMGLLGELKVTIDTEKKTASVENADALKGIIEKVLKENPELKARSSNFGDDRGGQPPADGVDVSKLSPTQMMEAGYRERQRSGSRG